jgi:hypothetical protein
MMYSYANGQILRPLNKELIDPMAVQIHDMDSFEYDQAVDGRMNVISE